MQLQILKKPGIFVQMFVFVLFCVGLIFGLYFLFSFPAKRFFSLRTSGLSLSLKCSLGVFFEYTSQMVQDSIAIISR